MDNLPSSNSNAQEFAASIPSVLPTPPNRNPVLFNDHGLRAGWRLLLYFLLLFIFSSAINPAIKFFHPSPFNQHSPSQILPLETINFLLAFGCAWIMSRIERRSPGEYGLPLAEAFGRKFWLGMLLGLVEISVLIGLISAFGGYTFGSLALSSKGVVGYGLLHLAFFTMVGFFEEFTFRGYTQFTLADGVGFWPAAIVLSLGFGAVHLLFNRGENPVGAASVALVGIFFAFTLYRTGNLWYAVGLHASFDWGETYLFSVPNSGTFMEGHLSNSVLHGAKWLTGDTVGPEGSVFCFLTMGLQFLVVMWLFPKKDAPAASAAPPPPPHTT